MLITEQNKVYGNQPNDIQQGDSAMSQREMKRVGHFIIITWCLIIDCHFILGKF